jgi:hypothetical protein
VKTERPAFWQLALHRLAEAFAFLVVLTPATKRRIAANSNPLKPLSIKMFLREVSNRPLEKFDNESKIFVLDRLVFESQATFLDSLQQLDDWVRLRSL